jgi:ribosome-interacting GTPase 1
LGWACYTGLVPTNVTAEYKQAEAVYRAARDPQARLDALREMLRTVPKHKGTEHLQADLKSRIKELTEELSGPRAGAARSGPPTTIRPEGAAQVALLGPPNSGKSALHARLTGSHAAVEPYPFATQYPQPGMLEVNEVQIQLVDLPSVSPHHEVPWLGNALSPADAALLVIDLGDSDCLDHLAATPRLLTPRKVTLTERWPADPGGVPEDEDPFVRVLPTALVVAKADRLADPAAEVEAFRELSGCRFPLLVTSAETGDGLEELARFLFDRLGIVRVYTRAPGRKTRDDGRPFAIRRGQTVLDVARLVHKELAESLSYARLWGSGGFDGQQVGRDHVLSDGDVVELHT